ncbi:major facilitator superfamily domain-containing protein [Phascolomyces articulosus]|uniref:Major facilitator superfamily domain-containing protein n=1 Tax=Phascolomyces articulosus TaxID=60185 RepID=A0AAD5KKJ1_9FUNG|nr:major facilitator superfamily domain-containing protein [Phascolomyces articulosus]
MEDEKQHNNRDTEFLHDPSRMINAASTSEQQQQVSATTLSYRHEMNNNNTPGIREVIVPPSNAVTIEKTSIPHMMQAFYMLFVMGVNDANIGIIIPSLKVHYSISQAVVSALFLCVTIGNFTAAFMNGYLITKTSQTITAVIGAVALFIGFLICLFAVPFPVMCCAQVVIGFGNSLVDASANVICGEMPRGTMILNFLHAIYGLGALIAPLAASALLDHQLSWTITYIYLTVLAFINILTTTYFLRDMKTRSERERQHNLEINNNSHSSDEENSTSDDGHGNGSTNYHHHSQQPKEKGESIHKMIKIALTSKTTVMGAFFILFYVGAEVTLGSWGYTFLITVRSTDTVIMAQIMSGYWAGLCAGRLFLGYWTLKFGEKRVVYCYLVITLSMLFIFWFVPVVAASAAALAILGMVLGPLYPTAISVASKTLPTHLYAVSIGFIAAFGSAGSAILPYITGVMIGARGVGNTMAPFCIAMTGSMLFAWFYVPNPKTFKANQEETATTNNGTPDDILVGDNNINNIELTTITGGTEENIPNTRLRVNNNSNSQ